MEHYLQLLTYNFIINNNSDYEIYRDYKFCLFNLKNKYIYELHLDNEALNSLIKKVIKFKTQKNIQISDNDFVNNCFNLINCLNVNTK
ncbi:hypothetical protein SGLAD_v1c06560 [Spiroplasma gladiatoris]|uniref:Uncharacterized protein n=1 Tax=Spiroplasma gladiatoris TaxID=2143 RepID=A0A4P7AHD2_9MOLU|nr:hypothetical protein SGLAD_v1c06560 [Spiroplasma gladiatoris]